eukprot:1194560-Prorocentrum_minimum.AAC.5
MGNVISRFEGKGFHCKGLKLFQCPRELAEEHYKDLSSKPFFKDLVDYIISGPVVCMVWEGPGVVKSGRKLIGYAAFLPSPLRPLRNCECLSPPPTVPHLHTPTTFPRHHDMTRYETRTWGTGHTKGGESLGC